MNSKQNKAVRGFTLIELITAVAVAAILIGLATPSFREYQQNSAAISQSNQMVADMSLARMEAVKNGGSVRISARGGDWNDGWVVASDRDRNGALNGPDQILRESDAAEDGFAWDAKTETGTAIEHVFFDSNGYLAATSQPLMFQLHTPDNNPRKCKRVALGLSGRAESRKGKNNPCTR